MTPTKKVALTEAFKAGYDHCRAGGYEARALTIKKGSLRDFWEAGYHKAKKEMEAEAAAYRASPEYQEQLRRDREMFAAIATSVTYLNRGDTKRANDWLNAALDA